MKLQVQHVVLFLAALLSVLVIQGAIPFVLAPTLGQAVWTTGFSHSFANDGWFRIYAHNIGAPEPAPIAFGLAGAWPAAILIRLGLHAADAYTAMAALWLTVTYVSAYAISRHFSVARYSAILAAFGWGTMPVIWAHAGYSMLSLGIGLLSFYFLVVIKAMYGLRATGVGTGWWLCYPFACVISVFMDGYSFMMFAVGSSILIAILWVACGDKRLRIRWALTLFPLHVVSFALAYGLYAAYVGQSSFEAHSLSFFRGWGVDLAFLAIPTRGMHWLPDLLGWSVPRSEQMYWGDASVWITSFALPLILGTFWAFWALRRTGQDRAWVWATGFVALFGFYMALGPSLKINTIKPPEAVGERLMEAKYAIAPTGSALLSEALPGFKVMRASYRWGALGVFGSWLLIVLALSKSKESQTTMGALVILTIVVLLNLPDPIAKWKSHEWNRAMFLQLDRDVLEPLKAGLAGGEMVAFLPWRNDFLVNYLASRLEIKTYNIGGDKNLQMARENWPITMREFPMAAVDARFSERILRLFAEEDVDAVVLPYIDMLWAAHQWPPTSDIYLREQLQLTVERLALSGMVEISDRKYYALVRLKSEFSKLPIEDLKDAIHSSFCFAPRCLEVDRFDERTLTVVGVLDDGALHGRGKEGFIVFGPYAPFDAGDYSLVVRGSGDSMNGAWIDVVSNKGTVQHGRWALKEVAEDDGILVRAVVKVREPVKDI